MFSRAVIITLSSILFVGCGGSNTSGTNAGVSDENISENPEGESNNTDIIIPETVEILAPANIRGKKYQMVVENGSGVFAVRGSFQITFSEFSDNYSLTGDAVNVVNSAGSYVYMSEGSIGTLRFSDSAVSLSLIHISEPTRPY